MKKKTIIVLCILTILLIVFVIVFVKHNIETKEYCDEKNLYERLNFELSEWMQVKELYAVINEETMKGNEREKLALKIKIEHDKFEDFIKIIEQADYLYWDSYTGPDSAVPHPERTMDEWDLDYSKLESIYGYDFLRKVGNLTIRCHVYIYILESNDGIRDIYIYYIG